MEHFKNTFPSADFNYLPVLLTREKFAEQIGLPVTVLIAQCERGYWPQVTVGKRVFLNVEAVRIAAAKKAHEFVL